MKDFFKTPHTPQKVVTVHDVSCVGRCAQTVIMPVMSALGIQVIPLPTALLSTHTGGFEGFTFLDLTEQMKLIERHWEKLGLQFDGVYTGFLGSDAQIENVAEFAKRCKEKSARCLFLADPVMGDDGEKYKTYTEEMCRLTKRLIKNADIITPNLTEACILTDTPYTENPSEDDINALFYKLSLMTSADAAITGIISKSEKDIGKVFTYYRCGGTRFGRVCSDYAPAAYPGTGDVFSSVLMSKIMNGAAFESAVFAASEFVSLAAEYTYNAKTPVREGLIIEPLLKELISQSGENRI